MDKKRCPARYRSPITENGGQCAAVISLAERVKLTTILAGNVTPPPPPCISYANVRNYHGPYAHCSLDKGVACAQHIQLLAHTCACAWYECTLTSTHISKCMQTQESLGNMKISGSHPGTSNEGCEAYKCSAWKPFLRSYTMRNNCTCSPLEDARTQFLGGGHKGV